MKLPTSCTIREAAELKRELLAQMEFGSAVVIDGSEVERADTAGVQLLVAFSLDCMERNVSYGWAGRSPALERAIGLLGVAALLESPGLPAGL